MKDSPLAQELLDAVARCLAEQVLPETAGTTAHAVRVTANLCRIVGRELAAPDGAEVDAALARLVGQDPAATTDDGALARVLDERLRSDDPAFDDAVADLLFADVCRRVDIAKPGYRGVDP